MSETTPIERDLRFLEADLKRLEVDYNKFFAGQLPKPPLETRRRVESIVTRYDRAYIQNYGERFRFNTLQSRFASLVLLWERELRMREGSQPGRFPQKRDSAVPAPERPEARILRVTAFRDPSRETDKLQELYDSLAEARRETGADAVPFDTFEQLVQLEVKKLASAGSPEVAFRVAVEDGKVKFTARALRGLRS